jgi:hypothetical protein
MHSLELLKLNPVQSIGLPTNEERWQISSKVHLDATGDGKNECGQPKLRVAANDVIADHKTPIPGTARRDV